ncbi:unnamed protein product [Agarophyton chilense]
MTLISSSKPPKSASSSTPDPPPSSAVSRFDARTHLSQFGAGALAGFINTLILSPLDVVKTRLQVQGSASFATHKYNGLFHALSRMLKEEGFASYYRGLSASLWAFVPNWAIYWYAYESFKRAYTPPGKNSTPMVHVFSALSAGGITAVTTAPFWTLKSRLQVDFHSASGGSKYRSVPHGFRKIIREEGVSALYKGLTPTLLGLGHVAIQFPLYEHLKSTLSQGNEDDVQASHVLVASSVSKIAASAVFYPHEVLRTRIQVDTSAATRILEPKKMANLMKDIMKRDGAMGFYRGFVVNLMRTVPACMLTFTSYELVKRYAEQYNGRRRQLQQMDPALDDAVSKRFDR